MHLDIKQYLDRIGYESPVSVDLATLDGLQRAHLSTVPFENLDVYAGVAVTTDPYQSLAKIVDQNRGGWCFELNGAFALLLEAIGFQVYRIGAAVLADGPSDVIDHLCLEVGLDEPYLVDVGFGDSFCHPLALNRTGPQDGASGTFELMTGAKGTTLTRWRDGAPHAEYRFRRVNHQIDEFDTISRILQADRSLHWHRRAVATRLLDGGPDRVSLVGNELKFQRSGKQTTTIISDENWSESLATWFGINLALEGPAQRPG